MTGRANESPDVFASHGEAAVRALHVMTMFSRLQENVEWLLNNWIMSFPDWAPTWPVAELRAIRDADRIARFRQAAEATRSSADLSEVLTVFNRVKSTRDFIAHTARLEFAMDGDRPLLRVGHYHSDRRVQSLPGAQNQVDAALLQRRAREVRWLLDQVQWVSDEAGFRGGPNRVAPPARAPHRLP